MFTITEGGVAQTYQVANIVVFERNVAEDKLQLGGAGNYMGAVTNATHMGVHYDVALMTCHGTPYEGGDASERWVVFANKV